MKLSSAPRQCRPVKDPNRIIPRHCVLWEKWFPVSLQKLWTSAVSISDLERFSSISGHNATFALCNILRHAIAPLLLASRFLEEFCHSGIFSPIVPSHLAIIGCSTDLEWSSDSICESVLWMGTGAHITSWSESTGSLLYWKAAGVKACGVCWKKSRICWKMQKDTFSVSQIMNLKLMIFELDMKVWDKDQTSDIRSLSGEMKLFTVVSLWDMDNV